VKYRTLGRTGLPVSEVGFGGGGIGAVWGATTDAEGIRAVHRALDLGITLFDVAPDYGDGRAEEVVGRALERPSRRASLACGRTTWTSSRSTTPSPGRGADRCPPR
jgi:aryl-alcohol dehydrogenase-like predicted oxidoreductase